MTFLIGILGFLFMLSVIVVIHELGHFLAARRFGVHCHEFSIGMGPALYQRQGKETLFSIRAIPFGGYVMMAGENDGSQDEEEDDWLKKVPPEKRLNNKKTWQQIVVMAAGVFMNVVLAFVIFAGLSVARGYIVEPAKPIVYEVEENSPAAAAGLQPGDEILKAQADGQTIVPQTQYELTEFIQFNQGPVSLEVKRGDETLDMELVPEYDEEMSGYLMGYRVQAYAREAGFLELVKDGFDSMVDAGSAIFKSLGMLIRGKGLDQMSGPVGILQVTTKTASLGWASYLSLFALISLNIGIFNLIPIPALDGGRILILALERVLGRKMNQKLVENVIMASFVFLLALMAFATVNDILRIFR